MLFAVTVDVLLRKLESHLALDTRRAFADDLATVTHEFWTGLPILKGIFEEFGQISGMHLSISKTVIVPLWPCDAREVASRIAAMIPAWVQVQIAPAGKYLGFMTGLGKANHSWHVAVRKFEDRVAVWAHRKLGLHYSALTHNTFAVSVLTFLAQLETPPPTALDAETHVRRIVATGPRNCCVPSDLWHLRESFGQTRSFASVELTALAAQVRVATWEAFASGGLRVARTAENLRRNISATHFYNRLQLWHSWYQRSHVQTLAEAVARFERTGSTINQVMEEIAGGAQTPWNANIKKMIRDRVQRTVLQHLLPNAEYRLRDKIPRWGLIGPEGFVARKILRRLHQLQSLVAP